MPTRVAQCDHEYQATGSQGRPRKTCGECVDLCAITNCTNKLLARGLCGTHYNQQYQPNRHRKVVVACSYCGATCEKEPSRGNRYAALYCSMSCRTAARFVDLWRERLPVLDTRAPHERRVERVTAIAADRDLVQGPTTAFKMGYCKVCGDGFITKFYGIVTCSDDCLAHARKEARRTDRDRRRALKREAFVAQVRRGEIFERDLWVCQICKKRVKRTAEVPDPKAPVLDHIVPLVAGVENGGVHAPWNVQCAHFRCNSIKSGEFAQPAIF